MKIPFVGESYQAQSLNANAERSVNCYVELMQNKERTPIALYGTPGTVQKFTLPTFPVRACYSEAGYSWWVAGNTVYRIKTNYEYLALGQITSLTEPISIASSGTELLLIDGIAGWVINTSTSTLVQITDVDFPNGVKRAAFQDGFFIVTGDNTQKFYINQSPNNGQAWNGLDFASAEGSPDKTMGIISDHRELYFFGENSIEPWQNTGNPSFPFERNTGGFMEMGCAAAGSIAKANNNVYWLGSDVNGNGIVWALNGYTPQRVSHHGVEYAIKGYSVISDAFAMVYQDGGHIFYILQFPTAKRTWVYDVITGYWHERDWRDPNTGDITRWRPNCLTYFNGVHLVGDFENGNVYALMSDTYTDNGAPIKRLRAAQTLEVEQRNVFYKNLIVDMECGQGLPTNESPYLYLRWSNDGGHTWSNYKKVYAGQLGRYGNRAKFNRLGMGRNRVYEITYTEPTKFTVIGAVLETETADS